MCLVFEVNTEDPKICYNHLTNPEAMSPASSTDPEVRLRQRGMMPSEFRW